MAIVEQRTTGGISFALTDEQKDLRALAREFAENEIRPRAAEYDEHSTHPADVIAKAHELGLMNLARPRGARRAGPRRSSTAMLIGEELAWGCSGIAISIIANTLGAAPVLLAGSDEQKREWLPPLLEEPILCSFGLTEPNAGSDVSGIQTTAVRSRRRVRPQRLEDVHHQRRSRRLDRRLRLDRPDAAAIAACPPSSSPATPTASRSRSTSTRWASARPTPSALAFQDVVVPGGEPPRRGGRGLQDRDADARPHAAGHGARRRRRRAGRLRARGRLRAGARPVRPADRHAPGRQLPDRGHGHGDRGRAAAHLAGGVDARPGRARRRSTRRFAKRFAADTAMKVTTDAVQIFGGYGYMKEYPVEKLMRDAKLFQIYEGTSQIQRLVIAQRDLPPA